MNIQEAKEEIKRSVSVYLMKDEYGNYRIPLEKQRPLFMVGAPGIGKTAIMKQIAEELNLSLVSYSMTHHTRQSALGLPYIVHKEYQGQSFDVSMYTLSEILASVYENMEKSGNKEGILFLDEINCVSETLGPSMLQFLQYKTFGNHRLPDGWVVVTAGNPPEFNRSVHEFDVATLDRLKVLNVKPDYKVWKTYAESNHLHPSIQTFLDLHEEDFYVIQTTLEGRSYVTARGWEDLSETLYLYEEKDYPVTETLIGEYIADEEIAAEFSAYYDLFVKYRSDYQIPEILKGNVSQEIKERSTKAAFDEKVSVVSLMLSSVMPEISDVMTWNDGLSLLLKQLRKIKAEVQGNPDCDVEGRLQEYSDWMKNEMAKRESSRGLSTESKRIIQLQQSFIHQNLHGFKAENARSGKKQFAVLKKSFDGSVLAMKSEVKHISDELDAMFDYISAYYGDQEMLVAVTQLTASLSSARFLALHPNEAYEKYSESLMLSRRSETLTQRVQELNALNQGSMEI